jgi:hypothetical protein
VYGISRFSFLSEPLLQCQAASVVLTYIFPDYQSIAAALTTSSAMEQENSNASSSSDQGTITLPVVPFISDVGAYLKGGPPCPAQTYKELRASITKVDYSNV